MFNHYKGFLSSPLRPKHPLDTTYDNYQHIFDSIRIKRQRLRLRCVGLTLYGLDVGQYDVKSLQYVPK